MKRAGLYSRILVVFLMMLAGGINALGQRPDTILHNPDPLQKAPSERPIWQDTVLQPLVITTDLPYAGTDHPRQRLDLYRPRTLSVRPLPVVVFFHGGGWLSGDKAEGAVLLMPLVETGRYAAISAGYRLSGEAPWPAQLHDCLTAIRYIRANAVVLGIDPQRIAVWGEDAGAHLALMTGLVNEPDTISGARGPHADVSGRVAAIINFSGITDMISLINQPAFTDYTTRQSPPGLLLRASLALAPKKAYQASPVAHVSPDDPPVLTLHGTLDQVVPFAQARELHQALQQAGVPSSLVPVERAGHGRFPREAREPVMDFLEKYLVD